MDTEQMIAKLDEITRGQPFGMIITRKEMPELYAFAPVCGDRVQIGRYTITRAKMDHLDQFTITKPLSKRPRCPECNMRLDADGSCWFCDNPEE